MRWRNRTIASADFQSWAISNPLTRRIARRDAARVYDLVSGFVYSQTLLACVQLDLFSRIGEGTAEIGQLARSTDIPPERMERLCQAAAALDLLERAGTRRYRLGRLGAAICGVPGLDDMIRHHAMFYRDIADPVALMRGETAPELAQFWPYVFGQSGVTDQSVAQTYSGLMTSSQTLVSEETLRAIDLSGVQRLLDVGGGTGAFLKAVGQSWPGVERHLFDLPHVVATVGDPDLTVHSGSFRDDPLPRGHDACSLIRVLYDHDDDTVRALLAQCHDALPPGGRILVSEPMAGGEHPNKAGDAYFGFYTLAMTTGRPRSAARHSELLAEAGFASIEILRTARPFITGVITARRPKASI
ncbi:acetylserotonin O-methyltransferase [Pontivivens insulae]|uniref:Demethylspheroidene O-methyltransferase n=1 Tax=Pontivivens insulae TaxID=1639689 RepID=A0A2R8AAB1_9RHOB|nr:acetylserotonin O-methyltransferase [Pontivivens insulae]SPF29000.1 Demethylspheroidene O-methyltransferase [Pontivivens insulae]